VLNNEREGKYLGKNRPGHPARHDEIKNRIRVLAEKTGRTSSSPKSAARPVTLRPCRFWRPSASSRSKWAITTPFSFTYLRAVHQGGGRIEDQPTQQSVAKLREIGIAPHALVCRCERPLDKELRQKISMFCNVPVEAVIEEKDVDHSIYEVPLMLQRERWTTSSAGCCGSMRLRPT